MTAGMVEVRFVLMAVLSLPRIASRKSIRPRSMTMYRRYGV